MSSTVLFLLVIVGTVAINLPLFRFIYKKSFVFMIVTVLTVVTCITSYVSFLIGISGFIHLTWGLPIIATAMVCSFSLFSRVISTPIKATVSVL